MQDLFETEIQKNSKSTAHQLGLRSEEMHANYLAYKNSANVVEIFIAGLYAKLMVEYKYLSTFFEMAATRPADQMPDGNLKSIYAKVAGIHFTLEANHNTMFKQNGELMHQMHANNNRTQGLGAEDRSNKLI